MTPAHPIANDSFGQFYLGFMSVQHVLQPRNRDSQYILGLSKTACILLACDRRKA